MRDNYLSDKNGSPITRTAAVESDHYYSNYRKFEFMFNAVASGENVYYLEFKVKSTMEAAIKELFSLYRPSTSVEMLSVSKAVVTVPGVYFASLSSAGSGIIEVEINGINVAPQVVKDHFSQLSIIIKPLVRWYYVQNENNNTITNNTLLEVDDVKVIDDAYYPYITQGIEAFIDEYLNDKSSILILMGPPGTGKTSFIKHLIVSRNLKASVTFDEKILSSDEFFVDWLFNSEESLLIVEDADVMLHSRKSESNKLISKFLNVSDGIVKPLNKKIIFTTNIGQVSKIDPALIRPGRCFDVVDFRELTLEEANAVAGMNGLPLLTENKTYTLAQIFNQKPMHTNLTRMGII